MKPNGVIAVTELSWIADDIPKEISEFWSLEYSEMQSVKENINTANVCGYHVESHFTLPESAWFALHPLDRPDWGLLVVQEIEHGFHDVLEGGDHGYRVQEPLPIGGYVVRNPGLRDDERFETALEF